ncbi:hypothetical protein ACFQ4K_32130 [Tistrella bauzanensis]
MTLNMAHYLPETYAGVEWERWWADQVAERSDGAITIEIFWGGTLGARPRSWNWSARARCLLG